ncbi:hypothetical protein FBY58_1079 [Zymomonas mobilis]|uniref:Uncharacterized protein n=1 Tax=Zymomonas mobilis TaxID=542 RepID=A0A542W1M2_ZYMMB|nr:hypothetical protein [Zymomonas mobilis]TQL17491.1 hypothetical protein FBY58_1079 [Zymomonas mobilis]
MIYSENIQRTIGCRCAFLEVTTEYPNSDFAVFFVTKKRAEKLQPVFLFS